MLSILNRPQRVCSGLTRRELLQVGGAGLLGLSLPRVLAAETAQRVTNGRAKSVIFLFLFGGPSQLETFDLKPDAPSGIRGPFRPIASRTPGLRISEHLPRVAALSDRFAVVRTVTHRHNDHNACHYIQTGHPMPPAERGAANVNATDKDWPAIGSVLEYLGQQAPDGHVRDFPHYVYLPNRLGHIQGYDRSGQYAGWLGRSYNALATEIKKRDARDNPYFRSCTDDELDFRIKGLDAGPALTLDRLNQRRQLLEQFDAQRRILDQGRAVAVHDRIRQRALNLVTSAKMRTALDIRQEPDRLRDRYGRHLFGQATLMGRRMIEAGARFVTVLWDAPDGYSWDSHIHSDDVRQHLLPGLDQTYVALLTDLAERGLLDETLVVWFGEFGRTPRFNGAGGRDHWGQVFSLALAGGGIRGGVVYGASDRNAAYPVDGRVEAQDFIATIFHCLGYRPDTEVLDTLNRPIPISRGRVIPAVV